MKIQLKPFQLAAVEWLVKNARSAAMEARSKDLQALTLASPTGSGKTIIAIAAIEAMIQGNENYGPDPEATFLWISDQPELNEQTRKKMLTTSTVLLPSKLIIIDSTFDRELFEPGNVYFLNIQKLGKDKRLTTLGDRRAYSIWDTINNTIQKRPGSFIVFIDEAHRGMNTSTRARNEANTIVQKFIKGSPGELLPVPMIIGISATPERFNRLIEETDRTRRSHKVKPEDVRASGLIKEVITFFHPSDAQKTDITMLRAAARSWKKYCGDWEEYCLNQNEPIVSPILTVQLLDGIRRRADRRKEGDAISQTDLLEAIQAINEEVGPLNPINFAHSLQEGQTLTIGDYNIRYVPPSEIQTDTDARVVFFKSSLNTGWDCPRAEVMMSFRIASDATSIAQLVGRMVRTPLARRIDDNEYLNSVSLYLPHYDDQGLTNVIEYLTSDDPEIMPPVTVIPGGEMVPLTRAPDSEMLFQELEQIPTYIIPRSKKTSQIRRLMKLSRLLSWDSLEADGPEIALNCLVSRLNEVYERVKNTNQFRNKIASREKIKVKSLSWRIGEIVDDTSEIVEFEISKENVDDLFEMAGKKLGEGLHKAWWKIRVDDDDTARVIAKLEIYVLSQDVEINAMPEVEDAALALVQKWLRDYRVEINELPETRLQLYKAVRQEAADPEQAIIKYPSIIQVRNSATKWKKHLYIDENGDYPADFNDWEKAVLDVELKDDALIGWLRNKDRQEWSLCVPYMINGEIHPFYPDFLFMRSKDGKLSVDLVDPHLTKLEDAWPKAVGLAQYASKHRSKFGKIELVIIDGGIIKRIDLCEERIQQKVSVITNNEQLRQIFAET